MKLRPTLFPVYMVSAAHALNDSYTAYLAALLPFLIPKLGLTLAQAGLLAAVFSLSASLAQPLFGFFTDRGGWIGFTAVAPAITAVALSSLGLWSSVGGLALAIAVGGISTAIFHPQAAATVSTLGAARRGVAMSIFVAAGTGGVALGPPLILTVVALFGLEMSLLAALPGVLLSLVLVRYVPFSRRLETGRARPDLLQVLARHKRALVLLWLIVVFRAWVVISFHTFLGVHLTTGAPALAEVTMGLALALFMASEAGGGLLGGYLSEHWGRKRVVVAGLVLAVVPLLALLRVAGPALWPVLGLAGLLLGLPTSVTVVLAQETVPEGIATASGLTMGAGWAVGGVMVAGVGAMADSWGLVNALSLTTLLLLVSLSLALTLPREAIPRGS